MSNHPTVLHVDMDSFFASVEQQANPVLRGIPIAVSGDPKSRTVVAAASKEAKKFGVKSAMTIGEARALCPQIQFVLGDPAKYVDVSRRVISIFQSYTPDVEVFSIDEAFLDVTGWVTSPSRSPSPDARAGAGYQEGEKQWCGAVHFAQEIKRCIAAEVGEWITCSIGIAPNKRLAKLASEFDKPDGLVVVYADGPPVLHSFPCHPEGVQRPKDPIQGANGILRFAQNDTGRGRLRVLSRSDLLASLKLRDLCGIGARIEARLNALGITTVGGLAAAPLDLLVEEFGVSGYELHDMAIGSDASPVDASNHDPKSMGHATTLPRDLSTLEEIRPVVEELSEKVAARLRRHGYRCSTIHVVLRFRDFTQHHFSQKSGAGFTSRGEQTTIPDATDDGLRISREVMCILQQWSSVPLTRNASSVAACSSTPEVSRRCAPPQPPVFSRPLPSVLPKPVRLVGVSVGKLIRSVPLQASLFPKDQRWRAATAALDAANDRYGEWTVQRASLLKHDRVAREVAAAFRATAHLKSTR